MYGFGILNIFFSNKSVASPMTHFLCPESRVTGMNCLRDSGLLPFVSLFTELFCCRISLVSREALISWKSLENHLGCKSVLPTLQTQLALQETDGFADILKWLPSQQIYLAVYWGDRSQETGDIVFPLLLTSDMTLGKSPHHSRSSCSHL